MPPVTAHPEQASLRAARLSAAANLALMAVQIATGYVTGSHAIVADGMHTFVDLAIDALLFLPIWLARGTARRPAAWLPATATTLLPTLAGAFMLAQALAAPADDAVSTAAQTGALVVAIVVIATRECVARHLHATAAQLDDAHAHAVDALKAGAWHARLDALSATAAAVGALGTLAGMRHLDQLAAMTIGAMMIGMGLFSAGGVLRRCGRRVRARFAARAYGT